MPTFGVKLFQTPDLAHRHSGGSRSASIWRSASRSSSASSVRAVEGPSLTAAIQTVVKRRGRVGGIRDPSVQIRALWQQKCGLTRGVEIIRREGTSTLITMPLRSLDRATPPRMVRPDQETFWDDWNPARRTVMNRFFTRHCLPTSWLGGSASGLHASTHILSGTCQDRDHTGEISDPIQVELLRSEEESTRRKLYSDLGTSITSRKNLHAGRIPQAASVCCMSTPSYWQAHTYRIQLTLWLSLSH